MERMKNFEKTAYLEANTLGEMIFAVQTDNLTIRTFYRDLNVQENESNDASQGDGRQDCCVKLDIKKFLKVNTDPRIHRAVNTSCLICTL
jgi:hypothetical protein